MKSKRQAATSVFNQQNVMRQEAQLENEFAQEEPDFQDFVGEGIVQSDFSEIEAPPLQAAVPIGKMERKKTIPEKMSLGNGLKTSEELQLEKEPILVRETGFWFFKRIIVPPNAYVVHTRMNKKDPVTIGLGLSFRYNSNTDAYLVAPSAMQTIGVVANCISKEKQGINVLAYVQWQIDNFALAYRKLDFSDRSDPLSIVNAQLREQAEAAIKDKISTMSVEEVLTDKEPVIEELTSRLKAVSEGRIENDGSAGDGLGIKIVTVQIKEAYVSSFHLWENLQTPFRHVKEKIAKISFLEMQEELHKKELDTHQTKETGEVNSKMEIERLKQNKQTEAVELQLTQESIRFTKEQETTQQKLKLEEQTILAQRELEQRLQDQETQVNQERKLELARLEKEANNNKKSMEIEQELHTVEKDATFQEAANRAEQKVLEMEITLKKVKAELELQIQEQENEIKQKALDANLKRQEHENKLQNTIKEESIRIEMEKMEKESQIERLEQETRNLTNDKDLLSRLIVELPKIAAEMPQIHDFKVLQTNGDSPAFDALAAFVTKLLTLAESMGIQLSPEKVEKKQETEV